MSDSKPTPSTEQDEHRRDLRQPQTGAITAHIAGQELNGMVSNTSTGGIMFLSNDSVRITVEFESDGEQQRRHGRLVRVQGMTAEETAFAIEFDGE